MKVAVVFILLFATVLCRPARKVSVSSSESSEEVMRRPPARPLRRQMMLVPQSRSALVKNAAAAEPAAVGKDESNEDESNENEAVEAVEVKSLSPDTTSATDTTSVDSKDSEDSDDDDDEAEEADTDEDEDETSDSSESGETSTLAPPTASPMVVTDEPVTETTDDTIMPTVVTDARGDNLGGYPADYKSIIYVEDKSYHKVPAPYKSYEFVNSGKKMAYHVTDDNDVDKSPKAYKALQVHSDLLEEDTSTPEVESQGLDASSDTTQDQDISPRQASLPEDSANSSDASSSSSPQEEEEEEEEKTSTAGDSSSSSLETDEDESQSSEEATATPGAADSDESDSTESDSDEDGAGPHATTDMPLVITAK